MLIKLPDDTIINWDNFYSAEITNSGDIAFYFRRGNYYIVDVGDVERARKILDDIMKACHIGARTFEIKTNDNEATKAKGGPEPMPFRSGDGGGSNYYEICKA